MDEVEKYQQRLQAIAEKRRLQEEREQTKRQLEDEKLRLQQLKRKSLRDQWLMEGPSLSPNSADPWPQIEAHVNKLQSVDTDTTRNNKENGSNSVQSYAHHYGTQVVNAVMPPLSGSSVNGEEKRSDGSHDTSLINGTAADHESHNAALQHVNDINKGGETLLFLGYKEAEPGQGLCDEDDDDELGAVIRAERVIITEEGEEGTQDTLAEEEKVEGREIEDGIEGKRERGKEEEQDKDQVEKRKTGCEEDSATDVESHPEVTELEEGFGTNNTDVHSLNQDAEVKSSHPDGETSADADTKPVRDSRPSLSTELISHQTSTAVPEQETLATETPGGAIQTPSVSETPSASTLNPNGAQKTPDLALTGTHNVAPFQDISLGGATVEEEPLMARKVEPLTEAMNHNRAEGVKTKTCQCCMIM